MGKTSGAHVSAGISVIAGAGVSPADAVIAWGLAGSAAAQPSATALAEPDLQHIPEQDIGC
jgi:hypothetical protein